MKKSLAFTLVVCMLVSVQVNAQVGKFLKNVKNNVTKDLLGTPDNKAKAGPEPSCACDPAELIMEVGKYKIDYTELNISVLEDGRVLIQDKMSDNYYVIKNGVTQGPYKKGDSRIAEFQTSGDKGEDSDWIVARYKDYISKSGDKYVITFAGKTYGPYARIDRFAVSKSNDKFAAMATETIVATAAEGKKMDEAINNAKTQQEKMDLAMQYSQQMQQKMLSTGDPTSIMSKLITNVPNAVTDLNATMGGQFCSTVKYDDIVMVYYNKITDLTGKLIMNVKPGGCSIDGMFISSDNTRSACYNYGTLTFSDGKTLAELFNPHLVKSDGKVYLAYMYYSPKRNAIMQCKIPF
jgi:hypothetical protein